MWTEEGILRQLSLEGHRVTQPRRAVVRALLDGAAYSSPGEVHTRAKRYCPTVGLVTVYRTLDLLSEKGIARRIHANDGCHGYAVASQGHHHHLVCRKCGATVEFEGCDLSSMFDRVSHETGYMIEDHLLELVGLCESCGLTVGGSS
jgi:Fe2+ or Zn2+ uptake regulation protein